MRCALETLKIPESASLHPIRTAGLTVAAAQGDDVLRVESGEDDDVVEVNIREVMEYNKTQDEVVKSSMVIFVNRIHLEQCIYFQTSSNSTAIYHHSPPTHTAAPSH
ncbi:hypothetical protein JOB18_017283 [Solea senegalensis]|uniref:Uncharacterized protein n=1 Tax=Solea senegalensis TaxID=28829 RepID=A0AAV6Q231_SOLSE|nr:hypothetical protein JOB18_017283 [Solea senegalensis]